MRLLHRLVLVPAVVVLALSASSARAAVVGVEGAFGFHSFALGAVNDSLKMLNDVYGTNFDALHFGSGLEFALRVWTTDRLMLRFGVEATIAGSESGVGSLSYETGPVFTDADVTYFFANPAPWRVGIGAGIGSAEIIGEFRGPGGKVDLTGTGLEAHGQLEAEWAFTKRWSLVGQGGYRYARVNDTKFDDMSTQPETRSDFSGAFGHLGLAYDWR